MPKKYTPAIKFANRSAALKKMAQTVEKSQHLPSDKTLLDSDYSGVIRKKRGSKWPIALGTLFNPVPAYCEPPAASPAVPTVATLTGSNFTQGCQVYVDGQLVSSSSFVNEHALRILIPPHNPTDQEDFHVVIKVVREDNRTGSNDNIFRYELAPSVTSVVPVSGYVDDPQFISVNGTNLKPLSSVTFSYGVDSYSNLATWKSPNLIETTAPIVQTTGVYSVIVISNLGIPAVATGTYTYEWREPRVDSLINDALTVTASTDESSQFTISGEYFRTGMLVAQQESPYSTTPTWNGSSWVFQGDWTTMTSVSGNKNTWYFDSYLPPASASSGGIRRVQVFNDDGKTSNSSLDVYYQVGLPSVTSFAPTNADVGFVIGVTGNHYVTPLPATVVKVVDTNNAYSPITAVTSSVTNTTFEMTVPAGIIPLHTYKIYVSGANGAGISTSTFTARATPVITSVTPSTGGIAGFESTVIGSGFSPANTVFTVDSQPTISSIVMTSTTALVTMPSHSAGTAYLTATNYADPTFSSTKAFAYVTASSINSGSNSTPVNG